MVQYINIDSLLHVARMFFLLHEYDKMIQLKGRE